MKSEAQEKNREFQNTWATDVAGKAIHVSDTESGRNGYFCQGKECQRELVAVHREIPRRSWYFRHDAKDRTVAGSKCTYSDETHRHQMAKQILQRIKHIKVPKVCKYPPKGSDGPPMVLHGAKVVHAHEVRTELYFFESADGTVQYARAVPESAHLLVRSDVAFFDSEGHPILLIELRATHKVDTEKKAKLQYLGIDTVEVQLPTGPLEEIEDAFKSTERTTWLYNGTQYNTKYVRVPNGGAADVPPPDELQRRVFEESFACRKALVNHLLRAIGRCLESEQYRSAEGNLRSALSRVEEHTERAQLELQGVQAEHRARVESQFAGEIRTIEEGEGKLRGEEGELERARQEWEGPYRRRRKELAAAAEEIRGYLTDEEGGEAYTRRNFSEEERSTFSAVEKAGTDLIKAWRDERAEQANAGTTRRALGEMEAGLADEEADFPRWTEEQERTWLTNYAGLVSKEERSIQELEQNERNERSSLEGRKEELRAEFARLREQVARATLERTTGASTGFARQLAEILARGANLTQIAKTERDRKRAYGALKDLNSGAYETWYRPR